MSRTTVCATVVVRILAALAVAASVAARGPAPGASTSPPDPAQVLVDDPVRARPPFGAFKAGQVYIGKRRYQVVVADSATERREGLRGQQGPEPYQGMLVVFPKSTRARFTMAGVLGPVDVTFYRGDGTPIIRRAMMPCVGTDETCPTYGAPEAFRYALETAPETRVRGSLKVKAPLPR